jgi:hypothetical protein
VHAVIKLACGCSQARLFVPSSIKYSFLNKSTNHEHLPLYLHCFKPGVSKGNLKGEYIYAAALRGNPLGIREIVNVENSGLLNMSSCSYTGSVKAYLFILLRSKVQINP